MKVQLNSPLIPNSEKLKEYIDVINNRGWLTNFGPLHDELKDRLEDYLGVKNLLLLSSGTSALQVAGKALDVNKVLTTPFSFVATSSAFLWQGTPVEYADIDINSYNLSPVSIEKKLEDGQFEENSSVVATHVYGNPCDVLEMQRISDKYGVKLIYDAAHAFGVNIGDQSVFNFGDASILSFHATKVFNTVEGGGIVFKNNDDYELALDLINFGIRKRVGVTSVGVNAKMSEYHAAVGLCNLDVIDDVILHRVDMYGLYKKLLGDYVKFPHWHPDANHNGAYLPVILENCDLDVLVRYMESNGVGVRRYFYPLITDEYKMTEIYRNSKYISQRILCLPLHAYMSKRDVEYVSKVLLKGISV